MGGCISPGEKCSFPKTIERSKGEPIDKVYKFRKQIGGGSFGTVWLSHRKDYPKFNFAIKKINKNQVSSSEIDILRREIDVLREVDHPNIIKLFDTYEDNSHIFIVMEYCSGGELFTRITKSGCLHESEAKVYMQKMIMAVSHLHSLQIVHRDLKTENFLFDSNCAAKELKLIDFGLSNKFGKNFENLHSQVGTIYYVAPEVLKGSYDSKCDIWSLGVVLYTMLSGDLPFYDASIAELYNKLNSGVFHFNKPVWSGVSEAVKDLISKLLVLDPARRFSASEALRHGWFTDLTRSVHLTKSVVESITNVRSQSLFQRESLKMMVKYIPEAKINNLKQLFYSLDASGSGFISKIDLENALKKIESINEELVQGVMNSIDQQGTGVISYTDFISAAVHAKKEIMEDAIWIIFKEIDIEGTGEITEESVKKSIENLGMSPEQVSRILESIKWYGQGITLQKFRELVLE